MVGPGDVRDDEPVSGRQYADSLQSELERLRWLVVQTMDGLAGQVLDQIQITRGMAEQAEERLNELRLVSAGTQPPDSSEVHLRQVSVQIEEAMRDLPEHTWNEFAQTCTQLARTVRRLQQP
jgi:hypothetical protein